jgi:hypothetical protein
MIHYLMAYVDFISTRPILIAVTYAAVVGLVVVGRVRARAHRVSADTSVPIAFSRPKRGL